MAARTLLTCTTSGCAVCQVHRALVLAGAISQSSPDLRDGGCKITTNFGNHTLCSRILQLDVQTASYRLKGSPSNTSKMCDFGLLVRTGTGQFVYAIELKSRTIVPSLLDQLQAGLTLIYQHLAAVSATADAVALIASRLSIEQVKRIIQNTPGMLRKSRQLSFGGISVHLQFASCGTAINVP